jgi:glycyl-tRNA synthetase alpha chain
LFNQILYLLVLNFPVINYYLRINHISVFRHFDDAFNECKRALEAGLPLPAYDQCMIASHCFNTLDARKAISVTSRQNYILRIRELSSSCAKLYKAQENDRLKRVKG